MADHQQLIELQNEIVRVLAEMIDVPWDSLLVNCEIEGSDGSLANDTFLLVFQRARSWLKSLFRANEGGWKRTSVECPDEVCDLFGNLRIAMTNGGKQAWNSCTLEIDSGGKYRFSFSYDPPRRLNGIFDDEAYFESYVPRSL